MQNFLDEERNVVNGERVYPEVLDVLIEFSVDPSLFSFTWLISWQGPISGSKSQVYEAIIEPAILDYNIDSMYIFPQGTRVVEVISSLDHDNEISHVLIYKGKKGQEVDEIERITWLLEG